MAVVTIKENNYFELKAKGGSIMKNLSELSQINWSAEQSSMESPFVKGTFNPLKKAFQNGKQAARCGAVCPETETLVLKKGYSYEEARAYREGFQKTAGTQEEQSLRRAKRAGCQAALMGFARLSYHQLKRKNYSDQQVEKYYESYNRMAGDEEEQMNRRIKLAGYQAAMYGCKRPLESKLQKKGYNARQIEIYYKSYDNAAGMESKQKERKVKREAYQMARMKVSRPHENYLLKKGLDDSLITLFYSIFDKTTAMLF